MLHVLLSTLLVFYFNYFQLSQNRNQTQAKAQAVMMTLFQQNRFVPVTFLNQRMIIPTCRLIASRFQCYLLMYFKMNHKKQASYFLICLCCILLQIYFFIILSVYIYHSFPGKNFSLNKRSPI